MADATQTTREVMTGFNQVQQQLGLTPMSAMLSGFTPPQTIVQPPPQKHPAEIAEEMSAQMNRQVQTATHTFQAQNQFAQEFGQRLQQIQLQYVAPQTAQAIARATGQEQFGMGGIVGQLPSPIYQTQAEMGIYRPGVPRPGMQIPGGGPGGGFNAPMPAPYIPQPYMPLWPGGPYLGGMAPQGMFGGEAPIGRFGDPWQRQTMQQEYMGNRAFSQAMAITPTATGTVGAMGLGAAGAGVGRLVGGKFGMLAGGAAGVFGGYMGGEAAGEQFTDAAVRTRSFGNQLEAISRQFVTSGPDLHQLGRGLGQKPAIQLASQMQKMTEQGEMGEFNMRDVTRITGMAAQGGMLDMAQSGPQIASQVRNVARALQNFMKVAEEPDVQRAMQMMSNMRASGLSIPETQIAARNAQQFARMAGMSTQGIMATAGNQGALIFQQQGMTGGTGQMAGMGAAALARSGIAGGAFTPAQLAMAGGQQGLTQTLTEMSAANLNVRFPMMAALSRNAQGQLHIDPERLKMITSGKVSMNEQIAMADSNIERLARQGGKSSEFVLSEIQGRSRELQDEMGRRMGPMGMHMMYIQQAMNVQKELGGNITLASALQKVGIRDPNQAQAIARLAQNPETWRNAQQGILAEVPRYRQEEIARRDADISAAGWRNTMENSWVGDAGRGVQGGYHRAARGLRQASADVAEWFSGTRTGPGGGIVVDVPEHLGMSRDTIRTLDRRRAAEQAEGRTYAGPSPVGALPGEGEQMTGKQWRSATWDNTKTLVGAGLMMRTGPWGIAAGVGLGLLPEATEVQNAPAVRAARTRGGAFGAFAGMFPGLVGKYYDDKSHIEESFGIGDHKAGRRQLLEEERSIGQSGRQALAGRTANAETQRTQGREMLESYQKVFGSGDTNDLTRLQESMYQGVEELAKKGSGVEGFFRKTPTLVEQQEAAVQRVMKDNPTMSEAKVRQYVKENWASTEQEEKEGKTSRQGQQIYERLSREGGRSGKAMAAKLEKAAGDRGLGAATTLKDAIKEAKEYRKQSRGLMGEGVGLFGASISEESQTVYEEEIAADADKKVGTKAIPPELFQQLRMQQTLRDKGADEEADKLRDEARAKLKKLGFSDKEIGDTVAMATGFRGKAQEAALVHARTAAKDDAETRAKRIGVMTGYTDSEGNKKQGRAARAPEYLELARGAAKKAETAGGDVSYWVGKAAKDPKLAQELRELSRTEGASTELGGGGIGGVAEKAARGMADQMGGVAKALFGTDQAKGGGLGGINAKQFNQASINLLKASENFANAARAGNLGRAGRLGK